MYSFGVLLDLFSNFPACFWSGNCDFWNLCIRKAIFRKLHLDLNCYFKITIRTTEQNIIGFILSSVSDPYCDFYWNPDCDLKAWFGSGLRFVFASELCLFWHGSKINYQQSTCQKNVNLIFVNYVFPFTPVFLLLKLFLFSFFSFFSLFAQYLMYPPDCGLRNAVFIF